jgi:hypothetical protein
MKRPQETPIRLSAAPGRKTRGATILVRMPTDKFLDVAEVIAVDENGVRHKLQVLSVFLGD